jgi:hypothetical protein
MCTIFVGQLVTQNAVLLFNCQYVVVYFPFSGSLSLLVNAPLAIVDIFIIRSSDSLSPKLMFGSENTTKEVKAIHVHTAL